MAENTEELLKKHVEGDWREFEFKIATTENDLDIVTDLLFTQYMPDEAMSKLYGYPQDHLHEVKALVRIWLQDHLSFYAIHKESGNPAGFRISYDHKKDTAFEPKSIQSIIFGYAMKALDDQSNIFENYHVQNYAFFFATGIHRDFRQRGLVGEFYRRALSLAKARGFSLVKVCFSSPYSKKAATNLGFKQVAQVNLTDIKLGDGTPGFPSATTQVIYQSIYIL